MGKTISMEERGNTVRHRASFRTKEGRRILFRMGVVAFFGVLLAALAVLAVWGVSWLYGRFAVRHQEDVEHWTYAQEVSEYAEAYAVPLDVVYAVIETESHFDENAESSAGPAG